jgi:hypothetical protein
MDLRRGVLLGVLVAAGCSDSPPGRTYYQRNVEPILKQKCAGNTSGCHQADPNDPYSFAAGNFDVTSFENVQKRRDLLAPFGAYKEPLLLIKAVAPSTPNPNDPNKLQVQYGEQFLPLDVLHAGGAIIDVNSDAYFTLQTWMQNGATENGLKPPTPAQSGNGTCSTSTPPGFNPAMYMSNPNFGTFKDKVQPILMKHGCTSSNCHGAPQSDFYITCGDGDMQLAFNFSQAWSFVNTPVDDSQILRVPLAVAAGGRGHTGGDQFSGTDDADYKTIHDWAEQVGVLDFAMGDPVKQFFKDNVQPILLQRGCSFMACHSPAATNDFKLRSGTQGFFSAVALEKNYELLKNEFMAIELPDARRGRAVAKGILTDDFRTTGVGGIAHRAGSVLETPGGQPSDPTKCGPWAPGASPFCTIQEWITRERAALGTQVTPMNANDTVELVYVDRPAGQGADKLQFDTFQPGANLMHVPVRFGADFGQQPAVAGTPASLLGDASCAGATGGDISGPDVANDGDTVAFAARPSAGVGWSIWTVSIATGHCTQVVASQGTIHNFDPAWSPDGQYIVFASTRGKSGPSLSRERFLPQSDLWRIKLADGSVEQMTFLSNSEIGPQFMREGRVIMTTEKVSDGFYQLSGRRLNWDLTDYHPLLAQRKVSPYADMSDLTVTKESIGYDAATDIREGNDGNFMLILSDVGPDATPVLPGGAGALGIFNRSVGPFEAGRTDPGYLPSLKIIGDAGATGHAGATTGYRNPFYMPDGTILASFAPSLSALAWRLVTVSPRTSQQTTLLDPGAGRAAVDAVLAYKYPARTLYLNRRQLVFGGAADASDTQHAVIHMPDAPMVFTLLTGNLRRGRPVDAFRKARYLVVTAEGACPAGASCSANTNGIYQNRMVLGKAELADDGSVKVRVPSQTGVILELQDDAGNTVVKMSEEHQLGPGEHISMGVSQKLFDAVCGGCHGSVSGKELDIAVTPDALTGASQSASLSADPTAIGN